MSDYSPEISLEDIQVAIASQQYRPVHQWHPDREAEMDLVIRADGSWWHEGGEIRRQSMVELFSTILRLEADGRYCLVTPAEKLYIKVIDAPFVAVSITAFDTGRPDAAILFETNVGEKVMLDQQHQLQIELDPNDHPRPYLLVRDGLRALLTRSVYYQLAELCIEREGVIGVFSQNQFHALDTTVNSLPESTVRSPE